jgi:hypothetical protein
MRISTEYILSQADPVTIQAGALALGIVGVLVVGVWILISGGDR